MHDGHEGVCDVVEVSGLVSEHPELLVEGVEVLVVFIGFGACSLHLFLQLRESRGIGTLVLFQELEDLLDALRV